MYRQATQDLVEEHSGQGRTVSFLLHRRQLDMEGRRHSRDLTSKAGFYSTGRGILPFGLNQGKEWEWINVYQVMKKYAGPTPQEGAIGDPSRSFRMLLRREWLKAWIAAIIAFSCKHGIREPL